MERIEVACNAIDENGKFKTEFTGRGRDVSPEFTFSGIPSNAKTLAVVLRDMSHPLFGEMTHWLIWDLPVINTLPAGIAKGARPGIGDAVQGMAYGWHRYRGPKPPKGTSHRYEFTVYAVDRKLGLGPMTSYRRLKAELDGEVLGMGSVEATFE
ncbi:YbhB/YbcL family Raf kinase inhibitor-like protein [Bifidobacterium sp. ESL0775]|uniref:YbhB/YbcL family Raf kinase inhibitor-like protein n=1 Tax=Bifidobacterium sp. ESL0775 TaxID=2983230 RepID=UPI0023F69176|nr:YbhB/YbcL family Raf kinase inhibitor-like protein [Bifidobacterium sp. ESL0775]WEV68699.1 YbhB/YbcL family Raf kinase inhibitor-like protein [Bifidobacterium sp. ESL0775]